MAIFTQVHFLLCMLSCLINNTRFDSHVYILHVTLFIQSVMKSRVDNLENAPNKNIVVDCKKYLKGDTSKG